MKKVALSVLILLVVLSVFGFLFRAPLFEMLVDRMTADMYIDEDADAFDPGLPIGARFPEIAARYEGEVIRDVGTFPIDKGMIFVANRSADW